MGRYFVNLPLRYIYEDRSYLEYFLSKMINPELGLDSISIDEIPESWHQETARAFEDKGLFCSIHLPFHDLQPGSMDEMILNATRERLKSAIKIARIYNPRFMVAHANFIPLYNELFARWLNRSIETWKELHREWEEHPPIYLENVREYDPRPLADLLSELAPYNIKFCFDVGHWASYSGGMRYNNMALWIQVLSPFLKHLHLHDNDGVADLHLGLGVGNIPWAELFAGLELLELSPSFTLEPHTKEDLEHSWKFMKKHPSWFNKLGIRRSVVTGVV